MAESFTPRSLIAGRIDAATGKHRDAAFAAASRLLGTERVAMVSKEHQGSCWYLAVPAADIASHSNCTTPLAAALPGGAGHDGDGAYTLDLVNGLQAVVVKNGLNLHSFVGTPALVQRFIALEGASVVHPCHGEGLPWQLPDEVLGRREARLHAALTLSGVLVAVAAGGVWLWAAQSVSQQASFRDQLLTAQAAYWNDAVKSLVPSPYPPALAHLQRAIDQAIGEKGRLLHFDHQNGRSTWSMNINNRVVTGAAP